MSSLPFTASRTQILAYLLGVSLFSISFLVFLNSSVSFVITERIGQRRRVGDAVGTLGFADELVALVACPAWGVLSDRVGVRAVAVVGYAIVGLSLFLFVQARNVYPQLLLARLFFSLGGAATSTMVTAILPTMTHISPSASSRPSNGITHANGHNPAPSISSQLTITPARFQFQAPQSRPASTPPTKPSEASTSQLAGLVGMFTGLGALVALGLFLPLPARFEKGGTPAGEAVADSFYVVGAIAFVVAGACFFGLRGLPGEEQKGWRQLMGSAPETDSKSPEANSSPPRTSTDLPFARRLLASLALGFQDVDIGLGYLGGFVARASSVGISLFIPLFVNAYFISSGLCPNIPDNTTNEDIKRNCRRAYLLAASLTGTSQLVALLCAPLFGWLSGHYRRGNIPLLLAALAGVVGYMCFGLLRSPDPRSEDGSAGVFLIVALLGISQIGAIVCSLGLLGHGIQRSGSEGEESGSNCSTTHNAPAPEGVRSAHDSGPTSSPSPVSSPLRNPLADPSPPQTAHTESSPLLSTNLHHASASTTDTSRAHLKGSIAGTYSLAGGAGILLLTKVGGVMFDELDRGAPFFLLAGFNGVLFVVGTVCAIAETWRGRTGGRVRLEEGVGEGG